NASTRPPVQVVTAGAPLATPPSGVQLLKSSEPSALARPACTSTSVTMARATVTTTHRNRRERPPIAGACCPSVIKLDIAHPSPSTGQTNDSHIETLSSGKGDTPCIRLDTSTRHPMGQSRLCHWARHVGLALC